jgi:uncharacterized protein YceH (UPF0502 family)
MLRGPQTAGELRQRTERIHAFGSGEEVENTLGELIERDLVAALPRRPGERGQRYEHRLADAEAGAGEAPARAAPAPAAPAHEAPAGDAPAPSPAADGLAARVERLEDEVAALREQLGTLRDELGA